MTSANVSTYLVFKKGEEVPVAKIHQNHYCKFKIEDYLKFTPPEDYTIQCTWLDEEEEEHEGDKVNLKFWLIKNGIFPDEFEYFEDYESDLVLCEICDKVNSGLWRLVKVELSAGSNHSYRATFKREYTHKELQQMNV